MHKKIFINFIIVLFVGVLICGIFSVRIIEKNYNDNIEKTLISNAILIGELIGDSLVEDKTIDANQYLSKIKHIVNTRITVIDKDGVVLSDTEMDASKLDNHSNRPEVMAALKGNLGKARRYSETLKVSLLYIAQPIYHNNQIIGVLRLSTPLDEIYRLMSKLLFTILLSILAGMLIASLLGYNLSSRITRPINEMSYIASQMTKGEFDKRIHIESKDEIGALASSINYMAATLKDTIDNLNDKNARLEAIMSSTVNGMIAIDNLEKVLFINPIAVEMLDIYAENAIGKHFLEVVRNNQIDNYIKHIFKEKEYIDKEIQLNYPDEKVLKFYANPISHSNSKDIMGVIITIQDITTLRKLERIRSEFVANVSHELKTPLTSIKGFVETLKSGAIEDTDASMRFLNIIEDEADRLNRLISDILSLSELENKKVNIGIRQIDIKSSIHTVLSILSNQAKSKHIHLETKIQEDIKVLKGEPDNIKQMLINLIDNAIKYTPENGRVLVEAYEQENKMVISVSDNGIGIPTEHIPRLFERFYRVDKARSRNVGGTGLGLAIVKHIVKSFDGDIEVQSEVGVGTKFTIRLPEDKG